MQPYIHVEHSRLFPESITAACWTGAPWRFIRIPDWVLRRTPKAQLHWVSWRVRHHYQESRGELFLFGCITAYRLVFPDRSLMLDIHGKYLKTKFGEFVPGGGSVSLRRRPQQQIPRPFMSVAQR
jgi:hypothetical protein